MLIHNYNISKYRYLIIMHIVFVKYDVATVNENCTSIIEIEIVVTSADQFVIVIS